MLNQYINPQSPLGPFAADEIKDDKVAAELFEPHNQSFNRLLSREIDIIVGRRGSGKTALLNCYKYKQAIPHGLPKPSSDTSDLYDYDFAFPISSHKIFEKMQSHVMGDHGVFRPIESVVDEWERYIGDLILSELARSANDTRSVQAIVDYLNAPEATQRVQALALVRGKPIFGYPRENSPAITQRQAFEIGERYLMDTRKRFMLLFDSMDEYMIGDRVVDRTIGALLRYVKNFNSVRDRFRIKLSLPSEIFPEISRSSANPLRDMVKIDHVFWSQEELLHVAAHRYRLFLRLFDGEGFQRIQDLDFRCDKVVWQFWRSIFTDSFENEYGARESVITYILRHTQLLPRQFLVILERIIVISHERTGGYRELRGELASKAIESVENSIATEIFSAYYYVFPSAENLAKHLLTQFPATFSYDELERKWRSAGKPLDYESPNAEHQGFAGFFEMLLRIGIVGVCKNETARYIEAEFSYNMQNAPRIGRGNQLCIHPIFSRRFNCADTHSRKAILPSGVKP